MQILISHKIIIVSCDYHSPAPPPSSKKNLACHFSPEMAFTREGKSARRARYVGALVQVFALTVSFLDKANIELNKKNRAILRWA